MAHPPQQSVIAAEPRSGGLVSITFFRVTPHFTRHLSLVTPYSLPVTLYPPKRHVSRVT